MTAGGTGNTAQVDVRTNSMKYQQAVVVKRVSSPVIQGHTGHLGYALGALLRSFWVLLNQHFGTP